MQMIFWLLIFFYTASFQPLDQEEANWIAKRLFQNECGQDVEKLVWWNEKEEFASCGMGHFIWYPTNEKGPFEETFPKFLIFLKERGHPLPEWLTKENGCPWHSKQEFDSPSSIEKKSLLKKWLKETYVLQFAFIEHSFQEGLPLLLIGLTKEEASSLQKKIENLFKTKQGRYALIDYMNFKGRGTSLEERYHNQGWGLKQVLERMEEDAKDPVQAFVISARQVLEQRVANAPLHRQEHRWLKGWLARINSYTRSS